VAAALAAPESCVRPCFFDGKLWSLPSKGDRSDPLPLAPMMRRHSSKCAHRCNAPSRQACAALARCLTAAQQDVSLMRFAKPKLPDPKLPDLASGTGRSAAKRAKATQLQGNARASAAQVRLACADALPGLRYGCARSSPAHLRRRCARRDAFLGAQLGGLLQPSSQQQGQADCGMYVHPDVGSNGTTSCAGQAVQAGWVQ
jgi:hypothetical protein